MYEAPIPPLVPETVTISVSFSEHGYEPISLIENEEILSLVLPHSASLHETNIGPMPTLIAADWSMVHIEPVPSNPRHDPVGAVPLNL